MVLSLLVEPLIVLHVQVVHAFIILCSKQEEDSRRHVDGAKRKSHSIRKKSRENETEWNE